MKETAPSLKEWEDLYRAAIEFRQIESWKWMFDTDIFGVKNPVNREIGYCCVLGNMGELFALVVYMGTEGLQGYFKILSGDVDTYAFNLKHLMKFLMVSFESRSVLQRDDLNIIKKLNLRFRGPDSWPMFRSYRPGFFPWYLTDYEAKFLTLALQQVVEVSLRFKDDPDLLTSDEEDLFLVRVPGKRGDKL
ncbi:MAG: hypothetical protein ACE5QV_08465, partial [Fidelibacterota bacterium]